MPHEMPREAPTFYFSSSGLRETALRTIEKYKDIVAGAAFDEIVSIGGEFLKDVLWPQDYQKIRTAHETLVGVYTSDDELRDVEDRLDKFIRSKFSLRLYLAPIRCDGVDGHVVPPRISSQDKDEAWISTSQQLKEFLADRFSLGVSVDLTKFPPEPSGFETFEGTDTIGLTWFAVLARNEQVAISKLMMLVGALGIALAPRSIPKQSSARFGGVAHTGPSQRSFGAFYHIHFPTLFGNAAMSESRTDTHLKIHYKSDFDLHAVEQLIAAENRACGARIRRAVYFLGVALRSEEIAAYMFHASALDALFNFDGCSLSETAKIGLEKFSGDARAAKKMSLLLAIRGRLAHGKRQTPQEASDYLKYWRRYDEEPLDGFWRLLRGSIVSILNNLANYEATLERIQQAATER